MIVVLGNFKYNKFSRQPSYTHSSDGTVISNTTAEEELKCYNLKERYESVKMQLRLFKKGDIILHFRLFTNFKKLTFHNLY